MLGETIPLKNTNYSLSIGDGENHYILFDRLYDNSYFDIVKVEKIGNIPGIEIEKETINHYGNETLAIRISGGKEKIKYDRVLFNKRLFVDVETNRPASAGGGPIPGEQFKLWVYKFEVEKQVGWKLVDDPLWNRYAEYTYNYDYYWYYTDNEYIEITNYDSSTISDFILIEDIPNHPGYSTQYKYASKKDEFVYKKEIIGGLEQELSYFGWYVSNIPMTRYGYFYYDAVITNNPSIFAGTVWETVYKPDLINEKVSLEQKYAKKSVKDTIMIPVYEYTTDEIQDFVDYEDYNDRINDEYNNYTSLIQQVNDAKINDRFYSFEEYISQAIDIPQMAANISTWDVFNSSDIDQWTNTWGFTTSGAGFIYADLTCKDGNHHYKVQLYIPYFGIQWNGTYRYEDKQMSYDPPRYETWAGDHEREITYTVSVLTKVSSNVNAATAGFYGDTIAFKPGYGGNELNPNVLGSGGNWSSYYAKQGFYNNYSKRGNCTQYIFNGIEQMRNRIRWVDYKNGEGINQNFIVPISKMLKFPFYVLGDFYGLNFQQPGNGVTSMPMPTIDTDIKNFQSDKREMKITVWYKVFGDIDPRAIVFDVVYDERNCHHQYEGNADKINLSGLGEVQGVTSWNPDTLILDPDRPNGSFVYILKNP